MYLLVKVNGKKLYEYVCNNEIVERLKCKVNIKDIGCIFELDFKENECYFKICVICGKGIYIRMLVIDIGVKLGFLVYMLKLMWIEFGGFVLKDSFILE